MILQRYNINLQYINGKENIVADCFSRAIVDKEFVSEMNKLNVYTISQQGSEFIFEIINNIKLLISLKIADDRIENIKKETAKDTAFQTH